MKAGMAERAEKSPCLPAFPALSAFARTWNHWWLRKAPPHGIAILRILFGLHLLWFFGHMLPHVPMLFSNAGITLPNDILIPQFLLPLFTPPSPLIAWIIFTVMILSLFTFTIGMGTRLSACIASILYLYYTGLSFHQGMTSFMRLFLFILIVFTFSDAGKTFSYEMWRKKGSFFAWEPGSVLTQRLIAIQITATYLGVGWQKVWLPDWQGGEILFYSFQSMWATPIAWWFLKQDFPMWVYSGMVLTVTYFETALPFGLWIRPLRKWFMIGGVLFHAGISLFLKAIWWFYPMIAAYITFFEPEDVYKFLCGCWRMDNPSRAK